MVSRLVMAFALLLYIFGIVGALVSMASADIPLILGCALVAGIGALVFERAGVVKPH